MQSPSRCCAQVQKGSVVAAGAVVTPGKTVPSGEVWAGSPAKLLRKLEEEETGFIAQAANDYAALAAVHAAENAKTSEEIQVIHLSVLQAKEPSLSAVAMAETC